MNSASLYSVQRFSFSMEIIFDKILQSPSNGGNMAELSKDRRILYPFLISPPPPICLIHCNCGCCKFKKPNLRTVQTITVL